MESLTISGFDGIVPSVSPRALPNDSAQTHHNLLTSTRELRPLASDGAPIEVAGGAANPKTVYRYPPTSTQWKSSAASVNVVPGPINADELQRYYLSYNDGSQPPQVLSNDGEVRQLGVPKPTIAPTVAAVVQDQYSTDDQTAALAAIKTYVTNTAESGLAPWWKGASAAPYGHENPEGYADRVAVVTDSPIGATNERLFRMSSTGGAFNGVLLNPYTSTDLSSFSWIMDPKLGGYWATSNDTWPAWGEVGIDHWLINYYAYGLTYEFNLDFLQSQIEAMEMPGAAVHGTKLFTSDQVSAVMGKISDYRDSLDEKGQPLLDALHAKVTSARTLMSGGSSATAQASIAAFYASASVATLFDQATDNFASAVWDAATQATSANFAPPGG